MSRRRALDLDAFLALPWPSAGVRQKIRDTAARPEVAVLAAVQVDGRLIATAYTSDPGPLPDLVALWRKQPLRSADPVKSRTMQALDLIIQQGLTPHAAAQAAGISAAAVYRALARQEGKTKCPCCGQVVREGFEIDRSVLRDPAADSGGA